MTSAECAAWVQAIGSILAILAGFALVAFQTWQEKHSRVQTLIGLIEAVVGLLAVYKNSANSSSAFEFGAVCRRASCDLKAMRNVIFSVDLSAIGSGLVWGSFGTFITALDQLIVALEQEANELTRTALEVEVPMLSLSVVADRMRFAVNIAHRVSLAAQRHYRIKSPRASEMAAIVTEMDLWSAKTRHA